MNDTIKVINKSPIIGKVCKNVNYSTNKFDKLQDLLTVKVTNIHEDNTRSNDFFQLENHTRDFYIVKEKHRKFKDKKDYISLDKCTKHRASHAKLAVTINKILTGVKDNKAYLRQVKNSPYIFGCEQSPCVVMKHKFFVKYPSFQNMEAYTTMAYDVETDMHKKDTPVVMASVTFKEKIYWSGVRGWFDEKTDGEILDKLKKAENELLRDVLDKRNAVVIYELFDTPGQVVASNIAHMHLWGPDWVVSWNAQYDMECNQKMLEAEGYDLAEVYSDPTIPKAYQSYYYHAGSPHKAKLEPQERFPTVRSMAKWQWFDGMSFYAIKRIGGGKKDGYGLQATAEREGIDGKLYTDDGGDLPPGSPDWHKHMQKNHKYVYAIYNIKDNIVIEELNEKTMDYSLSLPMLLKSSEFFNYPSKPKCISDELSFIALENGKVWGTCGNVGENVFNKYKQDLGDWIAILEPEKNSNSGSAVFEGLPGILSMGRGLTNDLDVAGAYPTIGIVENISDTTTRIEGCKIQSVNRLGFRKIGVNYASSPKANAIGLCSVLHGFPDLLQIDQVFDELTKLYESEK